MATQHDMQDPTTQYYHDDFPDQRQQAPGLDSKLHPLADHGSDTYVGSGRLKGRKALITGADSGIGRAVAIAYAREGADVALSYLPSEQSDADEVIREIEAAGQKAVAIPGDIREEQFCQELVRRAKEGLGGLDILVNNASEQHERKDIQEVSTDQLVNTFTTNVFALFWITQAVLPHLPAGASIINTSSIQAASPSPDMTDYAATKAAGVAFTQSLAKQLAPRGIRVNAVLPGPVWTPLQTCCNKPPEKLQQFGQRTPLGRAGQPAELAPAYVFLASQESSYVTAETIKVTGGLH